MPDTLPYYIKIYVKYVTIAIVYVHSLPLNKVSSVRRDVCKLPVVCVHSLTLKMLHYNIYIITHLKLCLATATHNFKWVKTTTLISLTGNTTFAKFIPSPITVV